MGVSVAYRNAPRGAEFMKDLYAVCAITTEHVKSVNSEHGQDCCQPAVLGLTYQCLGGCHQLLQVRTALKLMDHVCQHWTILLSKWGNSKAVKHRLRAYSIDSSLVTSRYDSSDWMLTEIRVRSLFALMHPPLQKMCWGWCELPEEDSLPSGCVPVGTLCRQIWWALCHDKA